MRRIPKPDRSRWCTRTTAEAAKASVIALVLAFIARYAVHPWLDDGIPTFTFLLATFYIAWFYGYRWGVLQLTVGFMTATYFFVKPYNTLIIPSVADFYRLIYFFSVGLTVVLVFEKIRRDRHEAEITALLADERFTELIQMDRRLG